MTWNPMPAISGLVVAGGADVMLPGPSKDEWFGVVMALVAVAVREVIWWLMNRRASKPDEDTTVQGG